MRMARQKRSWIGAAAVCVVFCAHDGILAKLAAPASIELPTQAQNEPNPSASMPEASQEEGFTIAGTVVNAMTGAPLARVEVTLTDTRNRTRGIGMVTEEGGRFEFAHVPPGKYSLGGAKRGYISAAYQQHEQFSTAIVTGPDFETDKLVLRLMPMALIWGHVLDESGEPVRSARVELFVESHSGGMASVSRSGGASSDDRGYFDIGVLQPGTYFVSATATPWYAVHPTAGRVKNDGSKDVASELDVAYPTTYYGGATESDGATPIELKGGEHREIEIHLSPVPALHVTFQVPTGKDNQSSLGGTRMPVFLKRVFDFTEFVPTQMSGAPGTMEISGLSPGNYEVRVTGTDGSVQLSEIDLERSGQELNPTEGTLLGKLKLTVKMAGGLPLPRGYFVRLQDAKEKVAAFHPGDATGQVTFEGVKPGKYMVVVLAPEGQFAVIRTISASRDASAGNAVNIPPGGDLDLTAEVVVGEVQVQGIAEKNGKPASGVMVALVPQNPEAHTALFRRDQSDFDGTFSLHGVIPGTYTVVAVEDAWGSDWMKPEVLGRYLKHGQAVTVADGMRGVMRLPEAVEVQER
jgi:5-hydroxyisourate hydrolase-like protein (transthyretin family)